MGLLHALNVVALPVIGRLLSLNRRLDEEPPPPPAGSAGPVPGVPPLGPGTWIVRVEPGSPDLSG